MPCEILGFGSDVCGTDNLNADPLFVDPEGPDGIVGTADDDLRLMPSSPAIDAGDPAYSPLDQEADLDGTGRINQCRIDIGAYESPYFADCNENELPDGCEAADGLVDDCNANLNPDACDPDLDMDGLVNGCDEDTDGDGVADNEDDCDMTPFGLPVNADGIARIDQDFQCDIDLDDLNDLGFLDDLQACLIEAGPDIFADFPCRFPYDVDLDGDVDLHDVSIIFDAFTGPIYVE